MQKTLQKREGTDMKKHLLCAVVMAALTLSACGQEEAVFTLTAAQQEQYTQQMEEVAEEYYWDFDGDSLRFAAGIVPENTEENADFFAACAETDHNMTSYAGTEVVVGTANLMHYNGDAAGQLMCYFSGSSLIGVCYQGGYDNSWYSLNARNPYETNGNFQSYENWEGMNTDFSMTPASFPKEGFLSTGKDKDGNVLTASLQDGAVQIYRYQKGALRLWRTLTFGSGLEATSATFFDGAEGSELAVVLSSITEEGSGESEHVFTRSEKILFYDTNMQKTSEEISLESNDAGALAAEGSKLMLSDDKTIQYYERGEGGWSNTGFTRLKHTVEYIHITDLDGNGVKEYLMSDGMDLYLYQKNDNNFRKIWSTHLGVESLYGPITSGDLNRDGVKEVYVCDMTGTTIRYLLTEKGLRSSNEDIVYAQCIYPYDLNSDGLDDYWLVTDIEERNGSLCMAEQAAE